MSTRKERIERSEHIHKKGLTNKNSCCSSVPKTGRYIVSGRKGGKLS